MNFFQLIILFQCMLLTLSSCNSKDGRRISKKAKKQHKSEQVQPIVKKRKTKAGKRDTMPKEDIEKLVLDNDRNNETALLKSIDSLTEINIELTNKIERHSQSNYGIPSTIDILWTKFLNDFRIDGNQSKKVVYNNNSYDTYLVNVSTSDIRFYWRDKSKAPIKSLSKLSKKLEGQNEILVFATNGGMYTSSNAPQGLFIQDGKILQDIDRKKDAYGNFYMQPNGVFVIDTANNARIIRTSKYKDEQNSSMKFATQSGPMAVINGIINNKFKKGSTNLNIRSGVGIVDSNHVVFLISNERVNLYDFAHVFRDSFHCSDALYLDGAISEMYLPELRRFQNGGNFGPMIGVSKKMD